MCRLRIPLDQSWRGDLAEFRPPRIELMEPDHSFPVLRCSGELDTVVAAELRSVLEQVCGGEPEGLLLDFADVQLLDARVLGLIEAARVRLAARGATLRILATGQPLRLLRLTGIAERAPRVEPWPARSSSSSYPTPTSGPTGAAATR